MKIRCTANSGKNLIEPNISPAGSYSENHNFNITIDNEYVVYAISTINGSTWFAICVDQIDSYPVWMPAELFEVIDRNMPREFVFGVHTNGNKDRAIIPVISFSEWVNDPEFYAKVAGFEEKEIEIFRKYKYILDFEHDKYMNWEPANIKKCLYAGDSVINALTIYEIEKCVFPEKLNELIPGYMTALPAPSVEDKHWIYSAERGKGYFFGFSIEEKGRGFIIYRTDKERQWRKIIG